MRPVTKERFLRDEGGFTLVEMMITITLWLAVLLALYGIFDMGVRVSQVGNNKVEAVESARVGLAKMEREIRQAYVYNNGVATAADPANSVRKPHLFWNSASPATPAFPAATSVTFGNDLDGDRKIEDDVATEQITYAMNGTILQRNGQPAVESVQNATFTYFDANRNPVTSCPDDPNTPTVEIEECIAMVRIALVVTEDPGDVQATQRLTTEIDLRNR